MENRLLVIVVSLSLSLPLFPRQWCVSVPLGCCVICADWNKIAIPTSLLVWRIALQITEFSNSLFFLVFWNMKRAFKVKEPVWKKLQRHWRARRQWGFPSCEMATRTVAWKQEWKRARLHVCLATSTAQRVGPWGGGGVKQPDQCSRVPQRGQDSHWA